MEIAPIAPAGRQSIDSYQSGKFRISGHVYEGSVLVFPGRTLQWPVSDVGELSTDDFAPVVAADPPVDVLLLGCGRRMALLPSALRRELREAGLLVEPMDTAAACRTYNIMLSEQRRVVAALIAL